MTNLAESTFTDHSVEVEVIKRDLAGKIDILGGCTTHDSTIDERGRGGKLGLADKDGRLIRNKERSLCQTRQSQDMASQCKPRGLGETIRRFGGV